jgi:Bacterial extracellular solute-binding protein
VPASDVLRRRELLPEAEKVLGLKITFETISGNDLQARITSAIQSGTGADIIHGLHNRPHLYAESVADVSDVAELSSVSALREAAMQCLAWQADARADRPQLASIIAGRFYLASLIVRTAPEEGRLLPSEIPIVVTSSLS